MAADPRGRSGRPLRRLIAQCGLALLVLLFAAAPAHAACEPPRYRVSDALAEFPNLLFTKISVSPADVTPARLLCLAPELKRRFKHPLVVVNVFDSPFAADQYLDLRPAFDPGPLDPVAQRVWQTRFCNDCVRAQYWLEREESLEYLRMKPFSDPRDEGNKFILLPDELPECHLRVGARCLLAFARPADPRWITGDASGTVTLSATITPEGAVADINLVSADSAPVDARDSLIDAARRQLASWRVEPSSREERLRITYARIIDSTMPQPGELQVDYALPDRITVTYRPFDPPQPQQPPSFSDDRIPFWLRVVAFCGTPLVLAWGWVVALLARDRSTRRTSLVRLALAVVSVNAVGFYVWVAYAAAEQYTDASWQWGSVMGRVPSLTMLALAVMGALAGPRSARLPLILGGLLGLLLWIPTSW